MVEMSGVVTEWSDKISVNTAAQNPQLIRNPEKSLQPMYCVLAIDGQTGREMANGGVLNGGRVKCF